jgi:tetratricopeptide (TPR) repeat protein
MGGVAGTGVVIWATIKFPFSRKPKLELGEKTLAQLKPSEQRTTATLTVPEFIRIRKEMKADLEEEFKEAAEKDKAPLLARIAELERQIASPDEALLEAQKRIVDLEALLDRESNEFGHERINAAKAALERGDYSIADDIFAEIEAKEELAVQRLARASFGRGEVAEAEVRWHDAAKHYARAAQLYPNFETLCKARELEWRTGENEKALHRGEALLILASSGSLTTEQKATSLNNHALTLKALGRYPEAEALYREAISIGAQTIGEKHPDYAIRLNNLARVLLVQKRYDEAEKYCRQAITIGAVTIGINHFKYAIRLDNLAKVLLKKEQYFEAEKYCRQALAIDVSTVGAKHPFYATHLNSLANILKAQGRNTEAMNFYRQAIEIREMKLGVGHPKTINIRESLNALVTKISP